MADRQALILEAAVRVIARNGVRGLRVEELAAEAGVSTALIYYHFKDRAGLVQRTLAFISDRATGYTDEAIEAVEGTEDARAVLLQLLLGELQDTPGSARTASPGASCGPPPSSTRTCAPPSPSPPTAGTGTPPTPSRTPRRPVRPTRPRSRWTWRSG